MLRRSCIVLIKNHCLNYWNDLNVGELLKLTHAWFDLSEGTWSPPVRVLEI